MSDVLREQVEVIGRLFVRSTTAFAKRGHEIGERVRTIMTNPHTYGPKAVPLLARALGKKTGVLYDAAKVASVWTRNEFASLLERPNSFRQPLTFSHFVILAEVGDQRDELFELALSEGWSVRELRHQVLAMSKGEPPELYARGRKGRVSHIASAVEKVLVMIDDLDPHAASADIDSLRERITAALVKLDALDADEPPPSRKRLWGDLGPVPES